jgi:hypothetical protein
MSLGSISSSSSEMYNSSTNCGDDVAEDLATSMPNTSRIVENGQIKEDNPAENISGQLLQFSWRHVTYCFARPMSRVISSKDWNTARTVIAGKGSGLGISEDRRKTDRVFDPGSRLKR